MPQEDADCEHGLNILTYLNGRADEKVLALREWGVPEVKDESLAGDGGVLGNDGQKVMN